MPKWLHLLFLPHPDNNHRAGLLQPGTLALLIAVYLLNQSFIKSLSVVRPGILGYSSEITAQKVLDLTNSERQKINLTPLVYNQLLEQSAIAKAKDMFASNYWAHNSPGGKVPWDFFNGVGYEFSVAGENLARDFQDTDTMMRAWMNSPTHRSNIIHQKYQEIGIGVVNGILNGVKTTLVVQHFGTPLVPLAPQEASTGNVLSAAPVTDLAPQVHPLVNPLLLTQLVGGVLFGLILVVLVIDAWHTVKKGHHRLTGSTLGHMGFLLIIFLLLILTRQGTI
ncbi:MAG: CAP domain-containing protein [Candidatus Shapirobacteria bacterium]|jgi:uncharacterized protein YkwD